MSKLVLVVALGQRNSLALPAELAGRRTAIFGISGSGKSNTATVLIEGLLRHREQVVLIDPKVRGKAEIAATEELMGG